MNLVILGRPGSGKGTQSGMLSEKLGYPHISSGEIFRENIKIETELGVLCKKFVESGNLVPDEILLEMIRDRMKKPDLDNGYILEGTPRTLNQGKAVQIMFSEINREIDKVIYIFLERELMIQRLSGRWTCRVADHTYHEVFKPPKIPGKCDIDGSELYQREDQKPEAIQQRVVKYENETEPLISYYNELGLLIQINGDQEIEKVQMDIAKELGLF